jgi:hypothetical protein
MAIVKSVTISWKGKPYRVDVTMALINRIEEDVNLMRLASRLQSRDPPLSQVAVVFAHLLTAGGCTVTDAEVWEAMFGNGEETAAQVVMAATAALGCVFPNVQVKALEGVDSPKGKRQTATRGKKSTG